MRELPENWAYARLDELGNWLGGGTPSKANKSYWGNDIPWVSPKDMKTPFINNTIDSISLMGLENSAAKLIPAGSVLVVTRSGILAHSFPVAITKVNVAVNQDLKALVLEDGVEARYISWALNGLQRDILNNCSKDGTTVHSIELPRFMAYKVPLAPTSEQKRIVSKINDLFSEIERGESFLSRVTPLADRELGLARALRQSILKKAFSGQLVPQDETDEPASVLLERIKAEKAAATTPKRKPAKRKAKVA